MESKNFLILLLEFFQYWGGITFSKESRVSMYSKIYAELVQEGVTFPQRMRFISSPRHNTGWDWFIQARAAVCD